MNISERIQSVPPSTIMELLTFAAKAKSEGKKVYHLNIGQPDIITPEGFLKAIREYKGEILEYALSEGLPELIESIKNYYKDYNLDFDNNEILITNGGSEALLFTMLTICDEGDNILVPEPFYSNYFNFSKSVGVNVNPITTLAENGFHLPSKVEIVSKINDKTLSIKLSAKGVGNAQYKAYEYQPVDNNMQNVALLEKTAVSVTSALTLQITKEDKPVISILKVDQDTQKPLAGAVLLIKNSKGEEVYKFETKNEAEIITDITEYGTYTVEEVSAPAGYIKSNRTVSFTIDKEHPSHQITFENTKEVIVPDTANTSSIIMIILGIVLTGAGLNFVYKKRKKA